MERANLVAELVRDVDHLRHLVGAITVIVNENVSPQHFGESLVTQIARRWISLMIGVPLVPLAAIVDRFDQRRAIASDVSHSSRRAAALTVNSLRILTASHLQSVLGAGEFHCLHGAAGYDFEHNASSTDQVGGARQHLQRRYSSSKIPRELRILRPDGVLCPNLRSRWT